MSHVPLQVAASAWTPSSHPNTSFPTWLTSNQFFDNQLCLVHLHGRDDNGLSLPQELDPGLVYTQSTLGQCSWNE